MVSNRSEVSEGLPFAFAHTSTNSDVKRMEVHFLLFEIQK